jgi:hypothetical protein
MISDLLISRVWWPSAAMASRANRDSDDRSVAELEAFRRRAARSRVQDSNGRREWMPFGLSLYARATGCFR